nr:hypothetical protein [Methylomarinum sp. Ch1-1]MDP4521313.1 hypothetical protein [Methylomarinum sp. Ch1-1]
MNQSKQTSKIDPGWSRAADRVNAMRGLPPKQPQSTEPSSQEPADAELLAEELEGEQIRQSFQAQINANSEKNNMARTPSNC